MTTPHPGKPRKSFAELCNISFGFFGIQIGFALQNANMSRVFQSLGSSLDQLPALWVAAPLTGLLVQPIIGTLSDRTWLGRFGRRRPYFLGGALLATLALLAMPLAPQLLMAALLLWLLDASLNVSMEPFRAFVGDMLGPKQHASGYAIQTAFIGAGAVLASALPWLLDLIGVANTAPAGMIPPTVRYSFWAGGAALLAAVLWTVLTTREYSPDELRGFAAEQGVAAVPGSANLAKRTPLSGIIWIAAGGALALVVARFGLKPELFLLAGIVAGYGAATIAAIGLARSGRQNSLLASIVGDFAGMPSIMKRLALVQFFSWSALFIMWINTTPVVAQGFFGSSDPASAAYQAAGNWVGILFAVYNGVAAVAALTLLPVMAARLGQSRTHALCLVAGAAGFAGIFLCHDRHMLLICELGIGVAWASILALPYAMLASNLPPEKLGSYMGLFNIFVVLPQLIVATVMGSIMKAFFPGQPIWTMAFAAATLLIAALLALTVTSNSQMSE